MSRWIWIALLFALPALAGEIEEPASQTRFPDTIHLQQGDQALELRATGVGLRTKWRFKAYACVSYVDATSDLGDDPARALIDGEMARQLHMRPLRDFSSDKVIDAFREGFAKNDPELATALAAEIDRWVSFFTQDPRKGDDIRMQYLPGEGTSASYNGQHLGTIEDPRFARLVWGIYFGDEPVSGKLKEGMLSLVAAK